MTKFTKEAIKKSFMELLDKTDVTKITVGDITKHCGINRNSFYYHYHDIQELASEIIKEQTDMLIRRYPSVEDVETMVLVALDFAMSNKRAIMHIYRSLNRDIFEMELWKICEYAVDDYISHVYKAVDLSEKDDRNLRLVVKCQLFGLVMAWMNDGMKLDDKGLPTEVVSILKTATDAVVEKLKE